MQGKRVGLILSGGNIDRELFADVLAGQTPRALSGAAVSAPQAASACSRSAMMSAASSMPIERRTTSGPAPAALRCSSVSWRCVVEAGWMMRLRTSPMLARWENSLTLETSLTPAS